MHLWLSFTVGTDPKSEMDRLREIRKYIHACPSGLQVRRGGASAPCAPSLRTGLDWALCALCEKVEKLNWIHCSEGSTSKMIKHLTDEHKMKV